MTDVTRILSAIAQGDPQAAEQLPPLVYGRLPEQKPVQALRPWTSSRKKSVRGRTTTGRFPLLS